MSDEQNLPQKEDTPVNCQVCDILLTVDEQENATCDWCLYDIEMAKDEIAQGKIVTYEV